MSTEALSHVWKNSKQNGTALLVLVAIADGANQDGEYYPSVSSLAAKCRMKNRNLQRIIRKLEASGELAVEYYHGTETKRGWTNRYRVVMGEPAGVQNVAPVIAAGVQNVAPQKPVGVQNVAPVRVQDVAPRTIIRTKESSSSTPAPSEGDGERLNVFNLFEQTFGKMVASAKLADDLKDLAAEYPDGWIKDAFDAAALANATHINYVRKVLERRKANGGVQKPPTREEPPPPVVYHRAPDTPPVYNGPSPEQIKADLARVRAEMAATGRANGARH